MAYLSCNNLGKTFGGGKAFRDKNTFRDKNIFRNKIIALENFNLEVEAGEFIVVLGPSGCGKSTLLRLIAGLEDPDSGDIVLEGKNLQGVPPAKRNVALMFQHYTLFPHLTVYENMAYGLKIKKLPRQRIHEKISQAATFLSIEDILDRLPSALSGGQRQRAALGRAMIRDPKLFLLDEPLSNLDAQLRGRMRVEIRRLQKRLGITTLYVTHDQTEAMTMGDRIVVLNRGRIQQTGSPDAIYRRPRSLFVAGFMGSPGMNLLPLSDVLSPATHVLPQTEKPAGRSSRPSGVLSELHANNYQCIQTPENLQRVLEAPEKTTLGFRPEQAALAPPDFANLQGLYLSVEVESVENQGPRKLLYGKFSGHTVCISCPEDFKGSPGEVLPIRIPWEMTHWFDGSSGERCDGELAP